MPKYMNLSCWCCLGFGAVKMVTAYYFETLVSTYETSRRQTPRQHHHYTNRIKNLRSRSTRIQTDSLANANKGFLEEVQGNNF